ncbi:MAG: hypothetical protein ACRD3V_01540 [Vicinamibacteria bacterium]
MRARVNLQLENRAALHSVTDTRPLAALCLRTSWTKSTRGLARSWVSIELKPYTTAPIRGAGYRDSALGFARRGAAAGATSHVKARAQTGTGGSATVKGAL